MRKDKEAAIKLRKSGLSYNQIRSKLGIPKSTLTNWLSRRDWSKSIRNDLLHKSHIVSAEHIRYMNKIRLEKWEQWRGQARKEALSRFPDIKESPLFISGTMLYWGEGDSNLENSIVRLTNTDPNMIKLFVLFLNKICFIKKDQIKISLVIYKDLDERVCKTYWAKSSELSESNYIKSQVIKGRHPTKRLKYGICTVYVSSRQLKEKIMVWINLLSNNLINAGVV